MATPFANRRFITDEKIIREVLEACKIIHIGIQDGDGVYVVPTNYGYTYADGKLTFFTHGAKSGRKWDLIQKNPHVGFEIDTGFQLVDGGEVPCNFSNAYGSIIGSGRMSVVEDNEEKCRIMTNLMKVQADRDFSFTPAMVEPLGVAKIEVEEFKCKSGYLYKQKQ